jgi:hypothetical protein
MHVKNESYKQRSSVDYLVMFMVDLFGLNTLLDICTHISVNLFLRFNEFCWLILLKMLIEI